MALPQGWENRELAGLGFIHSLAIFFIATVILWLEMTSFIDKCLLMSVRYKAELMTFS